MKKNNYIELTAKGANVSYEAAENRMSYIRNKYGISYETFYHNNYYYMTESQIAAIAQDPRPKEDEEFMELVATDTGQSVRQIKSIISEIRRLTDYTVTFQQYYDYRLDLLGSIDGLALVRRLHAMNLLLERVRKDIARMVEIDLNVISSDMRALKAMLPLSISSRTRMEILAHIRASSLNVSASELNDLVEDIEFMHLMFEFSYDEYFMFGFAAKPLGERVKYLSAAEQQRYLAAFMDPFERDILTTDWKSHDVLKDYVADTSPSASLVEILIGVIDNNVLPKLPCVLSKDEKLTALIDYDTGTVSTNGQPIPKWNELLSLCREIGSRLSNIRGLGLIFAFSREQKWFLYDIECRPDSAAFQTLTNAGHRFGFMSFFSNSVHAIEDSMLTNGISYKAATIIADNTSKFVSDSGSYGKYQGTIRKEIDEEKLYRAENSIIYERLEKEEGIGRQQVDQYIGRIREATGYSIPLKRFAEHKMYSLSDDMMISLAETLKNRHDLVVKIRSSIPKVDKGLLTFADLNDDIEELRKLFEITLTEEFFNSAKALIYESPYINGLSGSELLEIIVDARLTRAIFGFSIIEYIMYNFKDKSIEERDSFIGNPERAYWTGLVNDISESEIVDNKFLSYRKLIGYYKRAVINIKSDNDYEKFIAFTSKVHEFFCKPVSGINGINVRYVTTHSQTDMRELFDHIRSIDDDMVIEEAINQSEILDVFNQDSVNTVRIITFNNGGSIKPMFALFRAGRIGSYVDVGRFGGTMVDVDIDTGELISDGIDIHGVRYELHPDTGVRYQGFQLPDWQQVIILSIDLAGKFPGLRYAFWDFAYNRDGSWVLMDCTSQDLMVNQAASGSGCRAEFLKSIEEVLTPDEKNQDAPGSILKILTDRFNK